MSDNHHSPFVSCIMPTANRRHFVPRAIEHFLRQDYPRSELVVVDDGADPIADLAPADPRVRYVRLDGRRTVGAKRNIACEQARGEVIAHWDDDDWHAPHRLSYQVNALLNSHALVCGLHDLLFYEPAAERAWRYHYPSGQRAWLAGSTLCYRRAFWERHPFADISVGEDARFIWSATPGDMLVLPESAFHIGIIHGANVSPKHTRGPYWQPCEVELVKRLMGPDWDFYATQAGQPTNPMSVPNGRRSIYAAGGAPLERAKDSDATAEPARGQDGAAPKPGRSIDMIAMARETDLSLTEYSVFNPDQSLPRMRRWELPFALFQARLANTSAVLDCSINPANLQDRMARLYPHVLYRRWNPIQNGQFKLPLAPDCAFDRVICINTLEHLLAPQRHALLDNLARKLRPGGRLVLTCDYYFDSFWQQPAILQSGLIRADRQEVFNGFNHITVQGLAELCEQHGLHPLADPPAEPDERDPGLFRQQPPFPHSCVGGVFCKGETPPVIDGKRVVLGLLTWNTRAISLDSVRAYAREAHMLNRLGQPAVICVCDNGSTDGTPEALRNAQEIFGDVPHKLILNPHNYGNSIARNQIIDFALEWAADYVLFMDGDIEVVPFSSFAMLRHMENCGAGLGCIGADSAGQTPLRERASASFYSVDANSVRPTNMVAWTQYGMFRCDMFKAGIRFDEHKPFDGAGWGFEDNDLAFQMDMQHYQNQRFVGMVYLHRNARSSVRIMRQHGIDADGLFEQRKQYVVSKWSGVPAINNGPLNEIRRMARIV